MCGVWNIIALSYSFCFLLLNKKFGSHSWCHVLENIVAFLSASNLWLASTILQGKKKRVNDLWNGSCWFKKIGIYLNLGSRGIVIHFVNSFLLYSLRLFGFATKKEKKNKEDRGLDLYIEENLGLFLSPFPLKNRPPLETLNVTSPIKPPLLSKCIYFFLKSSYRSNRAPVSKQTSRDRKGK